MRKFAMLGLALVPFMPASAQKQGTELTVGIASAGFTHFGAVSTAGSYTVTGFAIGGGGGQGDHSNAVALAFYLSSGMAIEPMVDFGMTHDDAGSNTQFGIGVGIPFFMKKDWGHTGLFIEPRAGITYRKDAGDDASTSQVDFGGSLGYKMKVSDHVSTRLEALALDNLKKEADGIPSSLSVNAVFSLSVFFGH